MPVLPDRNDSEAEACCRTQEGCDVGRRLDAPNDDHDDRADNRRRCKKVDPQNGRNFGEQDIPDRISARPADRAHHDGGDRRQPKRQSLFGPRHSEQRQTKSIYDDENVFRNLLNNVGSRRDRTCGGGGGRRPVLSSGEDTTRFFGREDASGGWNAKNVVRAPRILLLAASGPLFFCC
jgi:hypothetical protein